MKDLKDKVVAITGGATGIGFALAKAFGKEGAKDLAFQLNIPLLAEIPLVQSVRESGDVGRPAILQEDTPVALAFKGMIDKIVEQIEWRNKNLSETKVVDVEYGEPKCST